MSIAESLDAFRPVIDHARRAGWWTRGYLSTAFGCPYEGPIAESAVVDVAQRLIELGVDAAEHRGQRSGWRGRPTCDA